MIELVPKALAEKLRSPTSHSRDLSSDSSNSSGSSLLGSSSSPRPRWSRQRNTLLRPRHSRALCFAAAIAVLGLISAALLFWPVDTVPAPENSESDIEHGIDDGGPIPLGQSRQRGGREVFWWEQFPRLHGFYRGRKQIVPFSAYIPEQETESVDIQDPGFYGEPELEELPPILPTTFEPCYIDEERQILPPTISAYNGVPQGMSAPLFGSQKELDINDGLCYDRINRFAPYGLGQAAEEGGLGQLSNGDNEGVQNVKAIDWSGVEWHKAQNTCFSKNQGQIRSRTALIFRTWSTFEYTNHHIAMLRAMISELALATGGQYTVHFLIHVQDDNLPIWASQQLYNKVLRESLPKEFRGMGTLFSVAQMKLIYPPPFPHSIVNFSGGEIYQAYRSLHFPLQYFAEMHPEYDYFWQWEMDLRVTGHYHELLSQITSWAEQQPSLYAWERSSRFYIPSLYDFSYAEYSRTVVEQTVAANQTPIIGPQVSAHRLLKVPEQQKPEHAEEIVDLITFNPIFNPQRTRWAFHDDITGWNVSQEGRPPTRASLITASRMSRRLLLLMHEETYRNKHTMFPEMFPASIALHYGLKAVHAPLPLYFDHDWPSAHADEVFNNAPVSLKDEKTGMDQGRRHFHGEGGSVFGPGEHVFRGASYYSNAGFAGYLWRRWLGRENGNDEVAWESEGGLGGGRMCLPMMVLHPVKRD